MPRVAPHPNLSNVPFFASPYEDVPIDSIDIPSGSLVYDVDDGVLKKGMVFNDKQHLQSIVKDYSVRHARREYRVVESTPTKWKIICKQNPSSAIDHCPTSENCQWWLRVKLGGMESLVQVDPVYDVKYVIEHANSKYNYTISYQKVWQALKRARENVYGVWESSCQFLPKYMGALQRYNPGIVMDWCHKDTPNGVCTLCHDGGHRYGVMMTNISEAINSVLKGTQRLPITAIVSATFTRSKNAFREREEEAMNLQQKNQIWPDDILNFFFQCLEIGDEAYCGPIQSIKTNNKSNHSV
ncbi:hypothetical protein ACS0TY_023631 [Phlomoides rotata]